MSNEWTGRNEPLHPDTGEPTNEARAERVSEMIDAYAHETYGLKADRDDLDTVLQDFLTDVFHFAQRHEVDPDDVASRAMLMFVEEYKQEAHPPKRAEPGGGKRKR